MTAIKVENIGKRYVIDHQKKQSRYQYETLSGAMAIFGKRAFSTLRHPLSSFDNRLEHEDFWALKDINFEISQGDRVGIIGRNGAGKSTLLKILSRITAPTTGKITIKGRVSSLLEVGTGFHPELTGRENINLNGAILGMKHQEIKAKFDEIVAFAEVEKFLDTQVKHYSSGMYVRLAFAVAAHLEPEILIVDEVLAVGDAQFQKKCLGKIADFGKNGRTVLFVSHNMNAIERICSSCIMLENGNLVHKSSAVREIINRYLIEKKDQQSNSQWLDVHKEFSNPYFQPLSCALTDRQGNLLEMPLSNRQEVWVQITAQIKVADPALCMGYALYSGEGDLLYWSYQTDIREENWPIIKVGTSYWRSKIPANFLNEGSYRLEVIGGLHFREWIFEPGKKTPHIEFQISGGLSESPYWMVRRPGILAPIMVWEIDSNV
jgi:lipopolysaccharide transport system ATP-binding protein